MHTNEQNKCFPPEVSRVSPDFPRSSTQEITSKWYNLMNLLPYSVEHNLLAAMQGKKPSLLGEAFQSIPLILISYNLPCAIWGEECERWNDKTVIHPTLGGLLKQK